MTQGRHEHVEWVSSFALSYSPVGTNFKFYEVNSEVKVIKTVMQMFMCTATQFVIVVCCRFELLHISNVGHRQKDN